jgi:hypothetical protein
MPIDYHGWEARDVREAAGGRAIAVCILKVGLEGIGCGGCHA